MLGPHWKESNGIGLELGERRREHLVGELDQRWHRAARARERRTKRTTPRRNGVEHGGNEPGIGASEAVDGLLRVTNPDRSFRQFGQLDEDSELDWACILKLVDEDEVKFFGKRRADRLALVQRPQEQHLLVGEVLGPCLTLSFLVASQGRGCKLEHERKILSDVAMELWMAFMCHCGIDNRLHNAAKFWLLR